MRHTCRFISAWGVPAAVIFLLILAGFTLKELRRVERSMVRISYSECYVWSDGQETCR